MENKKELAFVIWKHLGALSESFGGWQKEANVVAWENNPEKLDIRSWNPEHTRMSRGITLTKEEAVLLFDALKDVVDEWR